MYALQVCSRARAFGILSWLHSSVQVEGREPSPDTPEAEASPLAQPDAAPAQQPGTTEAGAAQSENRSLDILYNEYWRVKRLCLELLD